jgi:hypothetical protein
MAEESIIYFVMIWVPFQNSYSPLTCSFKSLCGRMRFAVKVGIIGGGLPDFLRASCSNSLRIRGSSSERCEEAAS